MAFQTISRTRHFTRTYLRKTVQQRYSPWLDSGWSSGQYPAMGICPIKGERIIESVSAENYRNPHWTKTLEKKGCRKEIGKLRKSIWGTVSPARSSLADAWCWSAWRNTTRNIGTVRYAPARWSTKKQGCSANKTHYNPQRPDARYIVKPGKARKAELTMQYGVGTAEGVISHIHADLLPMADRPVPDRYQPPGPGPLRRTSFVMTDASGRRFIPNGANYDFSEQRKGCRCEHTRLRRDITLK